MWLKRKTSNFFVRGLKQEMRHMVDTLVFKGDIDHDMEIAQCTQAYGFLRIRKTRDSKA